MLTNISTNRGVALRVFGVGALVLGFLVFWFWGYGMCTHYTHSLVLGLNKREHVN